MNLLVITWGDMGIMLRERAQEAPLMVQKWGGYVCGDLQPEPQLPSGWEKCLDLKVCTKDLYLVEFVSGD